ncbi:FHA domain-containing protein [Sesbania bispinosa]|nr:FHA domain-containing protein [Sesbania bispinosa]
MLAATPCYGGLLLGRATAARGRGGAVVLLPARSHNSRSKVDGGSAATAGWVTLEDKDGASAAATVLPAGWVALKDREAVVGAVDSRVDDSGKE